MALSSYAGSLGASPAADVLIKSQQVRTSDGVRLHYLEAAPSTLNPALPVIVLLPGWCMPASIWRPQLAGLGQNFRVLALDPRGQGESEIARVGYTLARRTQDIAEFLAPLPRVLLVSWSLAVLESLHYVQLHGEERLAGLVLVDNSVGEPPAPKPSNFLKNLRAHREQSVASFVRALFATTQTPEFLAALTADALKMPLEASIALLSYPQPRTYWRDIARALRCPLSYVVTNRFAEQAQNLAQARPATQVEHFAQAGHALFVDEPQRFNEVVEMMARNR